MCNSNIPVGFNADGRRGNDFIGDEDEFDDEIEAE